METTSIRSSLDASPDVRTLGTVLGVWAHPDDEAYLSAGLMASARTAGSRVVVATATRGEQGTSDPDAWPTHRLARLRERELVASLAAVGVDEHHWLGHRDGELDAVEEAIGVAQVDYLMRVVRPDTVVTFGPDGMTGHPDHRTISRWVTLAWQRRRGARLWYATVTPGFHEAWGEVNDRIGLWLDPRSAPCTDEDDLAFTVHCAGDVLASKRAALRAHWSQTEPLVTLLGEGTYDRWWEYEYFRSAEADSPLQ